MNSFSLRSIGNLAQDPELVKKDPDVVYCRFALIGNDYAGKDNAGEAREITSCLWFTAFGALGEAIAKNARRGDQLIVEAHLRTSVWTDESDATHRDLSIIVDGFRFGAPGRAKRESFAKAATSTDDPQAA